jgi:hypothetical protein
MRRTIPPWILTLVALALVPLSADASIFIDALGFEDDVDIVVSPNKAFMVVPEEVEDGSDARIRIIGLDASGLPIAMRLEDGTPVGYENGVDPIIIDGEGIGFDKLILVPTESEDGADAHLLVWTTDNDGTPVLFDDIALGDLGFREDVDGVWDAYVGSIAFFLLESEDRSVRGILAIDVDGSDGDWGSCLLLSTDGRLNGDENEAIDWLPGLADGVDPELYMFNDRLRLVVPVSDAAGSDLLLVDFDSDELAGNLPPVYMSHSSVKAINAAGARPLAFPGYERDVDLMLIEPGTCEEDRSLIVPVEGDGDVADLYKLDEGGNALWVYSIDDASGVSIPGYEIGVDLYRVCNLAAAPEDRLLVPVENELGTDADLLIVNLATGHLFTRLEEPSVNPDLVLPGWEIGVDIVQWTPVDYVAPVEGAGADPGLIVFTAGGAVTDLVFDADLLGFRRSVDAIVAPTVPPALIVPIGTDDGADGDVRVYPGPPFLAASYSMEEIRSGLALNPFAWDVDLGLIDKTAPGELYVCLPEEAATGAARLRFEIAAGLPGDRVLVVATDAEGAVMGSLYMVDLPTANLLIEKNDVLGLETGLDMTSGNGPVTPGVFPAFPRLTGVDHDVDPTIAWDVAASVSRGGRAPDYRLPLRHANPFAAPGRIEYALPERGRVTMAVYDVAGRLVARAFDGVQEAGAQGVSWDARDGRGQPLPSGVYFVRVRAGGRTGVSKVVLVR